LVQWLPVAVDGYSESGSWLLVHALGYMLLCLLHLLDWDGSPYTRLNRGSHSLSYQHAGSYLCHIDALPLWHVWEE
jgi:hypothetical protein